MDIYTNAVILGAVEAATEFLPVSSTGHLILASEVLGFQGPAEDVFMVAIQLGAIAAVCLLYFMRIWNVAVRLPSDPEARIFALSVITAFMPAAVLGALFHDAIKAVLFSPTVVCVALVVGGVAMLLAEWLAPEPEVLEAEGMDLGRALKIGFFQCLALIPGVSRSGATIIGGLLCGVGRRAATEFSFFLAIPTMLGATVLDVGKNVDMLNTQDTTLIAVGLGVAFIVALPVVRWLVKFVSTHKFWPFAVYRIVLGTAGLVALHLI